MRTCRLARNTMPPVESDWFYSAQFNRRYDVNQAPKHCAAFGCAPMGGFAELDLALCQLIGDTCRRFMIPQSVSVVMIP